MLQPIGVMRSVFHFKNGTPRQSSLCAGARGVITIDKSIFNNPEHSLEGLAEFSHIWVIFIFHKNNNTCTKAKVKPPRLNGQRVGVFSTRSPYRPNNIGLSLVRLDKVEGASVYVSGIDILDGSPILDIKPYIPGYDKPKEEKVMELDMCNSSPSDWHMAASVVPGPDTNVGDTLDSRLFGQDRSVNSASGDIVQSDVNSESGDIVLSNVNSNSDNVQSNVNSDSVQSDVNSDIDCVQSHVKRNSDFVQSNVNSNCVGIVQTRASHSSSQGVKINTKDLHNDHEILEESDDSSALSTLEATVNEMHHLCQRSTDLDKFCVLKKAGKNTETSPGSEVSPHSETSGSEASSSGLKTHTTVASWLLNPPVAKLNVIFTSQALEQLHKFSKHSNDSKYQLEMFSSTEEAERSIIDILCEEPRSLYRRQHCQDSLYYFAVDVLHVTCWFDEDVAQVVRIKPVASVPLLQPQHIRTTLLCR